MNVLLCGGGTAGHINPAIAIAEEIKAEDPSSKILFIGREGGFENDLINKAGFKYKTVAIQGLKRSISFENIKRIFIAIDAKRKARKIIEEFKPDVILGTGGYVCWPVISAGKELNIPSAIHESNYIPGLTTKLLARKCDTVFLNNYDTKKHLPESVRTVVSGTPLLLSFLNNDRNEARRKLEIKNDEILIVSFGGSIGSEKMNETLVEIIKKYSSKDKSIKHIHATGQAHYKRITEKYMPNEKTGCKIVPYINNMPTVLHAADIVICRCGAITLSELQAVGVSSILIPSPNVTANHQLKNAKSLSDIEAAVLIEEKNLTFESLKCAIDELKNDENGRKKRAKTIKSLSSEKASKIIVNELFNIKKAEEKAV